MMEKISMESSSAEKVKKPSKSEVLNEWMFLALGVAYMLHSNFLYSTSRAVDKRLFPGMKWSFSFPTLVSSSFVAGYLVYPALGLSKLPSRIMIFATYLLSASLVVLFICCVVFMPGTSIGFYGALACSAVVCVLSSFTRSRSLGIALTQPRKCSLMEAQGAAVGGLAAGFFNGLVQKLFSGMSLVTSTKWSVITLFATEALWFAGCSFSYSRLEALSPKQKVKVEDENSYGAITNPKDVENLTTTPAARSDPRILWAAKYDLINVIIPTMVTFSLFPGVVNTWAVPPFLDEAQFGIYVFVLFRVADNFGRFFPRYYSLGRRGLFFLNVCRISFIAIFCLIQRNPYSPIWGNVILQFGCVAALGMTHGYCLALGNVSSPRVLTNPIEKQRLGPFVGFFNLSGSLIGTILARLTQIGIKPTG